MARKHYSTAGVAPAKPSANTSLKKEALKVCSHSVENTTSFKLDPDGSDA